MSTIELKTAIPGPKSKAILDRRLANIPAGLAKSTEVVVEKACGAVVTDVDGNTLLDFAGGIGVNNAGHCPPTVVEAVRRQAENYLHTCSLVTTYEPMVELAEMLNRLTPGDFPKKTLLANSGAEAVENAVNIARYFTKRPGVIVFEGGYHGRTLLTLSMTSKYALFKKGFGPFFGDIYRLPSPDVYRLPNGMNEEQYLQFCLDQVDHALIAQVDPSAVAAVVIEPVQGEGGFIPMPVSFLRKLRHICDQHGIVLIFDEIQCGMGRTGKLFASEHFGVVPDLTTMAKSLGSGLPISAVTGRADILDAPHPGGIGSTYGANPIACVAAIETLKILSDTAFLQRTNDIGEQIETILQSWRNRYAMVGDVRGLGGMRLVEFVKDKRLKTPDLDVALEIIRDAVSHGIILIRAGLFSNCIRLLPPLTITDEQVREGLAVLEGAIARAHVKRGL